jgi:ribosome modulation factor
VADLDHAYEAGYYASENRRSRSDCPLYAMGEQGRVWRAEWLRGFDQHEAEYRKKYPLPAAPASKAKATPIRKGKRR